MDTLLIRARELKQELIDFVMDGEGELAIALETFSAAQLSRSQQQESHRRTLVIDRFLLEGQVGDHSVLDLFLRQDSDLSEGDRDLIQHWQRGFVGLFEIMQILPDGLDLMNWTTAQRYDVKLVEPKSLDGMARLKVGEILLTQIAPLTDTAWMLFSPWTSLGKLGKPKLAVAIGNFKQNYSQHLYRDAPELLEEAWRSVEQYHQDFLDFFGSDEVTLPGYQMGNKLTEFQQQMTQKRLDAAGYDASKSLAELVQEAGASEAELAEAAVEMGADADTVAQLLKAESEPEPGASVERKRPPKMATPQVQLPAHLKNAEQVTALSHPRWGQLFLLTYAPLKAVLEAGDFLKEQTASTSQPAVNASKLLQQSLTNPDMNFFVWQRLAHSYPAALEALIRASLDRPQFDLNLDLGALLTEFNKPLEPVLPEIASVPMHLHNLFQDAVLEVSKDKSKSKPKAAKVGSGFQRS